MPSPLFSSLEITHADVPAVVAKKRAQLEAAKSGWYGGLRQAGAGTHVGNFCAVYAETAAVVTFTAPSGVDGNLATVAIPAGVKVEYPATTVAVVSGNVVIYRSGCAGQPQ